MSEEKPNKPGDEEVNDPMAAYAGQRIRIYKSFEEAEDADRKYMASLSPAQTLEQMRKFINTAYGMTGYDPLKLPKERTIKIIGYL